MGRPKGWRKYPNNDKSNNIDNEKKKRVYKRKVKKDDDDHDHDDDIEREIKHGPLIQECQPCSYLLEEMWTIGVYDCLHKQKSLLNDLSFSTSSNQLRNNNENTDSIDNSMLISDIPTSSIEKSTNLFSDDDAQVTTIGLPVWSDEYFTDYASFHDNYIDPDSFHDKNELDNSFNNDNDVEQESKTEIEGDARPESSNQLTYNKVSIDNVVKGERKNRAKKDKVVTLGEICEYLSGKVNNRHVLIKPRIYNSKDENWGDQPFEIKVHPQVGFLCDIHSHLCDAEVIGLLAGKWDKVSNILYVQAAFPCTTTNRQDDGSTDVEIDPIAELKVREIISNLDLQVIGWFHSHPKFCANPSVIDIENQSRYQDYMDCPFIGLIVSTYDENLPTTSAHHQWFHVKKYFIDGMQKASRTANVQSKKSVNMPMRLNVIMRKMKMEIPMNVSNDIAEFIRKSIIDMKSNSNNDKFDDDDDVNANEENAKKQKLKKVSKVSDIGKIDDSETDKVKKRSKRSFVEERQDVSLPNKKNPKSPCTELYRTNDEVIFIGGTSNQFSGNKMEFMGRKGRVLQLDSSGWYSVEFEFGEVLKARRKQLKLAAPPDDDNDNDNDDDDKTSTEERPTVNQDNNTFEENATGNRDEQQIMIIDDDVVEKSNEQVDFKPNTTATATATATSKSYVSMPSYVIENLANSIDNPESSNVVIAENIESASMTYENIESSSMTYENIESSSNALIAEYIEPSSNVVICENTESFSMTYENIESSSSNVVTTDNIESRNITTDNMESPSSAITAGNMESSSSVVTIENMESSSKMTTEVIEEEGSSSTHDNNIDNNDNNNSNCNTINDKAEEIEPLSSLSPEIEQNDRGGLIALHFQGSGGPEELGWSEIELTEEEVNDDINEEEKQQEIKIKKKKGPRFKKDGIKDLNAPPSSSTEISISSTGRQIKIPKNYDGGLDYDRMKAERREALREAKKLNSSEDIPSMLSIEGSDLASSKKKMIKEDVPYPQKRIFPGHKRKRRQISLIEHLQGNHESSLKALDLISNATVTLRFPSLCIATLTFYYGKHSRRTDITKSWKKITRIGKIRLSAIRWTELFGLNEKEQNEFIDTIINMISLAWTKDRRSNQV